MLSRDIEPTYTLQVGLL